MPRHARRYQNRTLELGMDALPTMEGEMVGVLLFKPGSRASEAVEGLADGTAAREFFASAMPFIKQARAASPSRDPSPSHTAIPYAHHVTHTIPPINTTADGGGRSGDRGG